MVYEKLDNILNKEEYFWKYCLGKSWYYTNDFNKQMQEPVQPVTDSDVELNVQAPQSTNDKKAQLEALKAKIAAKKNGGAVAAPVVKKAYDEEKVKQKMANSLDSLKANLDVWNKMSYDVRGYEEFGICGLEFKRTDTFPSGDPIIRTLRYAPFEEKVYCILEENNTRKEVPLISYEVCMLEPLIELFDESTYTFIK